MSGLGQTVAQGKKKQQTPAVTFSHAVVVQAAAELDASSYNVSRVGGRGAHALGRKERETVVGAVVRRPVLPRPAAADYLFRSTGVRGA